MCQLSVECLDDHRSIIRFTIEPPVGEVLTDRLPFEAIARSWIVPYEDDLYIGGLSEPSADGRVVKYNPATDTVTILPFQLPPLVGAAAAIADETLYVFGGRQFPSVINSQAIFKVDLNTFIVEELGITLPGDAPWGTALYNGCGIYLFNVGTNNVEGDDGYSEVWEFGRPYPCTVTPAMELAANPATCTGHTFAFLDMSSPEDLVDEVVWDFGDGNGAFGQVVSHTYTETGSYTVTMTVTDTDGATTTATQIVDALVVSGDPCAPVLTVPPPLTLVSGEQITLCASATPRQAGTLSFAAEATPPGSGFDTATGCLSWTAAGDGVLPCIRVTVTEQPSGLSAWGCMRLRVVTSLSGVSTVDSDGDGVQDWADNCPSLLNQDQSDRDRDGIGDACDAPDDGPPGSGIPGRSGVAMQQDTDSDGRPDALDNCPAMPNLDQADIDVDGIGDACDADLDGDGVLNTGADGLFLDNCPTKSNASQADADGDGRGDACAPAAQRSPPLTVDHQAGAQRPVATSSWLPLVAAAFVPAGAAVALLVTWQRGRRR